MCAKRVLTIGIALILLTALTTGYADAARRITIPVRVEIPPVQRLTFDSVDVQQRADGQTVAVLTVTVTSNVAWGLSASAASSEKWVSADAMGGLALAEQEQMIMSSSQLGRHQVSLTFVTYNRTPESLPMVTLQVL